MAGEPASGEVVARLSRRTFLGRTAALAAAAQLPLVLGPKGLLERAEALDLDVARQALEGLAAYVLPGNDPYSVAQGVTAPGPGGVGAGAVAPLVAMLDRFIAASAVGADRTTVPVSTATALLLDDFAQQVDPLSRGPFVSPFARLSDADKARALQRFDEDQVVARAVGELRYVSAVLLPVLAFMAFSEAPAYDPATRTLRRTPVGWDIAGYTGPAHGHAEFGGYFQGRKRVRR